MRLCIVCALLFAVIAGCGGGNTVTAEKVTPPPKKAEAGKGDTSAKIVP